jgi:branched-subunit amino acid aminotransferase/4-amino-4-deoxychorismate lyase
VQTAIFEFEGPSVGRGLLREVAGALPEGAYTTLRTYGGDGVVRLPQHVIRLNESIALQGGHGILDEARARGAIAAALERTRYAESRLRLRFAPPRLFVSVEPFQPLPEALYRDGVACVTLFLRRPHPHAKDTRFVAAAEAAYKALPPGVHEGIMVGEDGALLEGLSSNFFAVRGGRLHTEENRALRGVTRSLVLELAPGVLPVSMTAIRRSELPSLSESFVTSASRGVLPVVTIDGVSVGDGRPGPFTRALIAGFDDLVTREAESVL